MKHLSATLLVAGLLASPLWGQIVPVGVTGTGPSINSASLLVDGVTPPQYTEWQADTNVWWTDFGTSFGGDLDFVAAMDFGPVTARLLRIEAVPGGDGLHAIGEVTAYGRALPVAVPEPSTYGRLDALALAG